MFDQLIHADWSKNSHKRWSTAAKRKNGGWVVDAPALVGPANAFLDGAFAAAQQRVLLGFDFPIGVPVAYGVQTGFGNFRELLDTIGQGPWRQFSDVATIPQEIAITRPFYPSSSKKGASRDDLTTGLRVNSFDNLLRVCERRTEFRQAACALFWTLGGNQVGKGALTGWREVIRPALARGAALWPFDGDLAGLSVAPRVVLAETYPAEAYRMVGSRFLAGQSKRRQADRQSKAAAILAWAGRYGVVFTDSASAALVDGFGSTASGEDQFDSQLGLLKMIEVTEERRAERTESHSASSHWEGWILGR